MLWEELLGKEPVLGTYANNRLAVDGKMVVGQKERHILQVPLQANEQSGAAASPRRIQLDFAMKLPHNDGRMSYDDHAIWLGNWLLILAVHEQAGWRLDAYEPVGDPFYSEIADYEVNVTYPAGYQLASTAADAGAEVAASPATSGGKRRFGCAWKMCATSRSCLWTRLIKSGNKGGQYARSHVVAPEDDELLAKRIHEAGAKSLAYFQEQLGAYPYAEYDVVRTGGAINGMEYPALVFLDGRHFAAGAETGIVTVAHETAHQWFYGLLGNDQLREAWLDEGFTEYVTLAFLSREYPLTGAERVRRRLENGIFVQWYVKKSCVLAGALCFSRQPELQRSRLFPDVVHALAAAGSVGRRTAA